MTIKYKYQLTNHVHLQFVVKYNHNKWPLHLTQIEDYVFFVLIWSKIVTLYHNGFTHTKTRKNHLINNDYDMLSTIITD